MCGLYRYMKICFWSLMVLMSAALTAAPASHSLKYKKPKKEDKVHVVVAMPFRPNMPFDPHWYTPEYVKYIADLLPAERYNVTGYFVSLENIPKFLDDMKALHDQKEKVCVLNVCDGGEWDGYPGISVLRAWEKHSVNGLIPMSGADAEFIFNSDDKAKMNAFIGKAKIKALPQALVDAEELHKDDLESLLRASIKKEHLDESWPLFCKLNIGAGALGIGASSICHNISELVAQVQKMHLNFPKSDLLLQPYLPGPEYTVFVLKDRVYVAVQRDFHNSYNVMEEDYLTGINPVEEEITYHPASKHAQQLALKAIQAIPGKHHYTRVDLRDDGKGNCYVIDINDRPGFGNPSTVKSMLEFHHLTEAKLLLDIIETCSINEVKK